MEFTEYFPVIPKILRGKKKKNNEYITTHIKFNRISLFEDGLPPVDGTSRELSIQEVAEAGSDVSRGHTTAYR